MGISISFPGLPMQKEEDGFMRHSALNIIYENPMPHLRAVNSCFPWVCRRKDGALLASHQMGQAFESVDGTTHLSISKDGGLTWSAPMGT